MIAILSRSGPLGTAAARRMLAASPHRGLKFEIQVCGNCALGVSTKEDRFDSALSRQGSMMAAFAGELDNASELAMSLPNGGTCSASRNPADLVLSAFGAYGLDAPRHMRGVFAAIITDGESLWCFRDHIGLRPLFFREDSLGFFVATEAKQIVAGAGLSREPDLEVLEQIFYGRMPTEMPCALKGVDRVPQATVLAVDRKGNRTSYRYWRPEQMLESCRLGAAEIQESFSEIFARAVSRTLTGKDVVSLSGGIDSTAIAAFAAPQHLEKTGIPIGSLSVLFPEFPSVDESSYIELMVGHLGTRHHTMTLRSRALDDVQRWCQVLDGPVPIISVPEISENYAKAAELGFNNVLSGEFAELVFGSVRHVAGHLLTHYRWKALTGFLAAERRRGRSWRSLLRDLSFSFIAGPLAELYLRTHQGRPKPAPSWLDQAKLNEIPYRNDLLNPPSRRWPMDQLSVFQGSTVQMEADELCATLSGVTVRRPVADVDLWEFFLALPAEVKFPDRGLKTLPRKLLRGRVPDVILDRRDKTAFDDYVMAQIDYRALRRFLIKPRHRVAGVNYEILEARIERADFGLNDWLWARDLARIHAFLGLWHEDRQTEEPESEPSHVSAGF